MGFEGVCDMPLRFADGIDDGVYLGNAEVIPNGRMVGRYGRVLTQPVFEGAYIYTVGSGQLFERSRLGIEAFRFFHRKKIIKVAGVYLHGC